MRWLDLSLEEQSIILTKVSIATGISEAAVEKDIYVCWCLQQLFTMEKVAPSMTFKGGTSLSKVYGSIHRFSEDVDITLNQRYFLGAVDVLDSSLSKKKLRETLEQLDSDVDGFAQGTLIPALSERADDGWRIYKGKFQTVFVEYPTATGDIPYLSKQVAIELGARNVIEPVEIHSVAPYAASHFPMVSFPEGERVAVLSPVRTFWEKATILHAEYHRPEPRASARIARHWYDIAMLAKHPVMDRALEVPGMLESVAEYKARIYPSAWASYLTARVKTLRLVPHEGPSKLLKADYESMVRAGFFFSPPPTWGEIVETLNDLEIAIRAMGG